MRKNHQKTTTKKKKIKKLRCNGGQDSMDNQNVAGTVSEVRK